MRNYSNNSAFESPAPSPYPPAMVGGGHQGALFCFFSGQQIKEFGFLVYQGSLALNRIVLSENSLYEKLL